MRYISARVVCSTRRYFGVVQHSLSSTFGMISKAELICVLAGIVAQGVEGQATVTSTQTITLPTSRPENAFNVPGNFPSVGFELAFLPGYNNNFSDNLIAEMTGRMGEKPIIRIGGTSGYVSTPESNRMVD